MSEMTRGSEQCETDGYATECPMCGTIQDCMDWAPYLEEKFECYKCGHEYTGMDLLKQEWNLKGGGDYYIPYYVLTQGMYKREVIEEMK